MKTKLANNLSVQDMISNVLTNATEKLAADEQGTVRQLLRAEQQNHAPQYADEEDEEELPAGIVHPDFVEKLASACDTIAANVHNIEMPQMGVLQQALRKQAEEGSPRGSGKGPGALEIYKSIGGKQQIARDKPAGEDAAASQAKTPLGKARPGTAATQLDNNMHDAPGGGGKKPTGHYPVKGPLVNNPYVSESGRKKKIPVPGIKTAGRDLIIAAVEKRAEESATEARFERERGDRATEHTNGVIEAPFPRRVPVQKAPGTDGGQVKHAGRIGNAARSVDDAIQRLGKRVTEIGLRSGKGSAARLAPGTSRAVGYGTAGLGTAAVGGTAHALRNKEKNASVARQHILRKLAGEDVLKANITAQKNADPSPGGGVLKAYDANTPTPYQAGDDAHGGLGNQARKLIRSNTSVIAATKRDAKGPVKKQLAELLDEPALSKKHDSVIEKNLRNAGKAGVKIAAARQALQKIASAGCQCESSGECGYCRLAAATRRTDGSTKLANAMMGMGMDPAQMGGMSQMADAGAGADGCSCGNTGQCQVCKLKAALAAAKAQSVSPTEMDPQGAPNAGPAGIAY